eukprot:8703714-Prorocentrum_lima.AAC.1
MTLKVSTWGAQGQPWWLHAVQEARTNHQERIDFQGTGQTGRKHALVQPFPTPPMAHKLESILR